jgi:hypothetical protein
LGTTARGGEAVTLAYPTTYPGFLRRLLTTMVLGPLIAIVKMMRMKK